MKKKIVFIMSSNYSGSHYLSQLLGSHSKAMHVGEVKNVIRETKECHLCGDTDVCKIFGGLGKLPKEKIYPTLFERAPEGVEVLIDNSKKIGWVKQFLFHRKEYDIKIIFLLRDPKALARRWSIRDVNFLGHFKVRFKSARRYFRDCLKILFANPIHAYIYRWLEQNQRISDFVRHCGVEWTDVTYYELASDTPGTLTRLTEFIGLDYEPSQIRYWEFEHHGTQKPQYEWIKKEQVSSHIDLRWKEFLTGEQIAVIQNHPALMAFLRDNRLEMHDNGLHRTGSRPV
ncbi:MAG: hypothetical protein ACU833_07620 [Gammaproteobacteria bacterium]